MAQNGTDTVNVSIVAWPAARKHLAMLAAKNYRAAARGTTEFERGRFSGKGEMAEELQNLPQALALLEEEDKRVEGDADVKG